MLVGNKLIEEQKVIELIEAIRKKKELNEVSQEFVKDHLFSYLTKNSKLVDFLDNPKSAKYKQVIKEVRADLRKVYGLFRVEEKSKVRVQLVDELLKASLQKRKGLIADILGTHASTKERLPIYEKLYAEIFKITGKPEKIVDLGCGINPFSVSFTKLKKLKYYAYDISNDEMDLLNKYFTLLNKKNSKFEGHAEVLDILHFAKLPKADVCFLFKMTDVLDRGKGHKTTEKVIEMVPAKWIVVSFATKTMSGKKMTAPKRKWMEWLCNRLGYKYKVLSFANELFYVVEK